MNYLARSVLYAVVLLAPAVFASPAQAVDKWITDIIRMSEDKSPEDGFCKRAPWYTASQRQQDEFLDRARIGSAEAAKFASGACSFTSVTDVYDGRDGKCVKYSWWACGPGKTCDLGDTHWCKRRGKWQVQEE